MADVTPSKRKKRHVEEDGEASAKKEKKQKRPSTGEEKKVIREVSVIARPLAGKKLVKKLLKLTKKAIKVKKVKRGVKEVQKGLRKGQKGLCALAGDISPIDVITHLPVFCEETEVPYVFVPSKEDLGTAASTKRPTSCVLILKPDEGAEYKEAYEEVMGEVKALAAPL